MLLETVLGFANHLLRGHDWAREKLKEYAHRSVSIELADLAWQLAITPEGYLKTDTAILPPCVTLSLPANALCPPPANPSTLLASARISGSAEFAECIGQIFRNVEWNVASELSPFVGDIGARWLAQFGQGLFSFQRNVFNRLVVNFADYLTKESPVLVSNTLFGTFHAEIAVLSSQTAKLAERVKILESRNLAPRKAVD